MSPLTPKQKALYDYIVSFSDKNGYPPSQKEMAKAFGWSSLGTGRSRIIWSVLSGKGS